MDLIDSVNEERLLHNIFSEIVTINPIENSFLTDFCDWYRDLLNIADQKIKLYEEMTGVTNSCRRGCSYCCTHLIEVYHYELINIKRYIAACFPPEKGECLIDYLEQAVPRPGYDLEAEKIKHRRKKIDCLFLAGHECMIHPVRPIACLRYFSYGDVSKCRSIETVPETTKSYEIIEHWILNHVIEFINLNYDFLPANFQDDTIWLLPVRTELL